MKATNEPKRDFESIAKLYMSEPRGHETASCYCGKVRAELFFPLSEQEMKEDNCSSCVRVGVTPCHKRLCLHVTRLLISAFTPHEIKCEFSGASTPLNISMEEGMAALLIAGIVECLYSQTSTAQTRVSLTSSRQRDEPLCCKYITRTWRFSQLM